MGLFDGVKNRLGGNNAQPDASAWQDDAYYGDEDPYYEDGVYYDQNASDGFEQAYEDEPYDDAPLNQPAASFSDYDPSSFSNITVNAQRPLQVASYDDAPRSDSYFGSRASRGSSSVGSVSTRSSRSNVRSIDDYGTARSNARATSAPAWDTPADPSFLDKPQPHYSRDIREIADEAKKPAQFTADFLQAAGTSSASSMEIMKPSSYGEVEKIAAAVKHGKQVVISLEAAKPEVAKRILDFSFGVAFALDGSVEKISERAYLVSKGRARLSAQDTELLRSKGILH